MRDNLNRRTFVGGLGTTALAVTVAGCGEPEGQPEDETPGEEEGGEPPGGDQPVGGNETDNDTDEQVTPEED